MSPVVYTTLHIAGIMLMYTALGGLAVLAARGGTAEETKPTRSYLVALHGVALTVILVAGFGLMAKKLGLGGPGSWPGYLWVKLLLWAALGGSTVLLRRRPALMRPMMLALPAVGLISTWLALFKPF